MRSGDEFFAPIEAEFARIGSDLGIMLNCVGHRHGWEPYHEYPAHKMHDVISVGTIVQARLSKLALEVFVKRSWDKKRSLLFAITALCQHPLSFFAVGQCDPWLSIPYLSIYEATNAWGFFHMNSLAEEYSPNKLIEFLNITPGAVLTEAARSVLEGAWPAQLTSCSPEHFVANEIRFMGRVSGVHCAYWLHGCSFTLLNFFLPVFINPIKRACIHPNGKQLAKNVKDGYIPPGTGNANAAGGLREKSGGLREKNSASGSDTRAAKGEKIA